MIDFLMKIVPTAFLFAFFFVSANHFYRSFGFHSIPNGLKYNFRMSTLMNGKECECYSSKKGQMNRAKADVQLYVVH